MALRQLVWSRPATPDVAVALGEHAVPSTLYQLAVSERPVLAGEASLALAAVLEVCSLLTL